jgi:hypothetical protein
MNCIDVVRDAVWIGKDCIVPCVNVELCKANGCYWRKFHQITPDQFVQRAVKSHEIMRSVE